MSNNSKQHKIKIGETIYTREQLTFCRNGINLYQMGREADYLLPLIEAYEEQGYEVKFVIPPVRKFFGSDKYRILAYKSVSEK